MSTDMSLMAACSSSSSSTLNPGTLETRERAPRSSWLNRDARCARTSSQSSPWLPWRSKESLRMCQQIQNRSILVNIRLSAHGELCRNNSLWLSAQSQNALDGLLTYQVGTGCARWTTGAFHHARVAVPRRSVSRRGQGQSEF